MSVVSVSFSQSLSLWRACVGLRNAGLGLDVERAAPGLGLGLRLGQDVLDYNDGTITREYSTSELSWQ